MNSKFITYCHAFKGSILIRRTTPNKKNSRKGTREQTHGQWFLYDLLGHLKKEYLKCLRIGKYTSCSCCWIHSGGFHQLWWIDSRPTICSSLQGFQQVRRSYDGIVLTLTLVARLVCKLVEGIIFFMWDSIITFPSNENSQILLKERT